MKIKEAREMIEFLNNRTYSIQFRWIPKDLRGNDLYGTIDPNTKIITINLPIVLTDIAVQIYLQYILPRLTPNTILKRADIELKKMRNTEIKIIGQLVLQKLFDIKNVTPLKIPRNSKKNIKEIFNFTKGLKIRNEWLGKRGFWGENQKGEFAVNLRWIIVDVFTHEWLHWKYYNLKENVIILKTKRKMNRLTVEEIKLLAKYITEIAE